MRCFGRMCLSPENAVSGQMVFTCFIVRTSATRSEWLASIRKSAYFYTGRSGVAARPGLCDKGERAQFTLAIDYTLLKKS